MTLIVRNGYPLGCARSTVVLYAMIESLQELDGELQSRSRPGLLITQVWNSFHLEVPRLAPSLKGNSLAFVRRKKFRTSLYKEHLDRAFRRQQFPSCGIVVGKQKGFS